MGGIRVLVAVTDRDLCESVADTLEDGGFEIVRCSDDAEARRIAVDHIDLDLIVIQFGHRAEAEVREASFIEGLRSAGRKLPILLLAFYVRPLGNGDEPDARLLIPSEIDQLVPTARRLTERF